eukprot:351152-Chlamydomonas_euryale.AAC.6
MTSKISVLTLQQCWTPDPRPTKCSDPVQKVRLVSLQPPGHAVYIHLGRTGATGLGTVLASKP